MTAVLHTHTRKLDYHPHLHIIVPAGALIEKGKAFKRRDNHYFIRGDVIAKIFRGKFLYQLYEEGFNLPNNIPKEWIVNVKSIGKGLPALQYLSRYLYRGEIDGGQHESLSAFIIKRTNLSRSYVYQVLAALREGGYITVKKGKLISIDRHIPEKF